MKKILQNKFFIYLFFALIAIYIGTFCRLLPLLHKEKYYTRKLATEVVYNIIKQQSIQEAQNRYPNLSSKEKQRLAERAYRTLLKERADWIKTSIDEGTEKLALNSPGISSGYLLEADSYLFYGLTENIKETGKLGPQIKHGRYFNPLMLAPEGRWEPFLLHPYIGYYFYQIARYFNENIKLIEAVKFVVIVLSGLCVIPFLGICRRLKFSLLATFVGVIFFILSPFFCQRTAYGWYDNDVYNFIFPLLIFFALFSGFLDIDRFKKTVLWAILAAFLTGLYQLFWNGWAFMFMGMSGSLPIVLLINRLLKKDRQTTKNIIIFYFVYFLSSFLFICAFASPYIFLDTIKEGWKMVNNFLATKFDLWPNVFLTVGETQPMPIDKCSFLLGGNPYFLYLALLGPVILFADSIRNKDTENILISTLLNVFSFILLYLSLRAVRFAVLLTVPALIGFTIFVNYAYNFLKYLISRKIAAKFPIINSILLFILPISLLGSLCIPIYASYEICSHINPIYNRTWEKTLLQIKNQTPKNSIINTWWCPGHFITAVAKRGVSCDGATQHEPQTYWIASALLAQDEETAVGILRMINSSGNKALTYLEEEADMLTSDAIDLLKEIVRKNESQARIYLLTKGFSQDMTEALLKLTHSNPPPSYFLFYNELLDTYVTLPYIGNWDFRKAEYLALNKMMAEKNNKESINIPSRDSKDYIGFILSMSGGLPAVSPQYYQVSNNDGIVKFSNGLVLALSTKECFMISADGKRFVRPKSVFYLEDDEIKEKPVSGDTLPYSVLLIEKNKTYSCFLLERSTAQSLLFKLYYLKGKGLKHFRPYIYNEDETTGTTIIVYKIEF